MAGWRHRFLNSKDWRLLRAYIIDRDKGFCQLCGEPIIGSPEVHHIIELTEQNYLDHSISQNPDLLETLHHSCHDIKHGRFGFRTKETIVDDDCNIDYSRRRVRS